jgi:thiol peroxidase
MATITLQGKPISTNGELPAPGSNAPDFRLVSKNLSDKSLAELGNKKKLLYVVPSLDTGLCATTTSKFNQIARDHGEVDFFVISADLPFAQQRVCGEKGVDAMTRLSMMRSRKFAKDYGILITEGPMAGVMARAVVVLDENNKVLYTELVPEISQEPDYDKAIAALS